MKKCHLIVGLNSLRKYQRKSLEAIGVRIWNLKIVITTSVHLSIKDCAHVDSSVKNVYAWLFLTVVGKLDYQNISYAILL
jgi:hypothetical protein